jgi:hypothetical protein
MMRLVAGPNVTIVLAKLPLVASLLNKIAQL